MLDCSLLQYDNDEKIDGKDDDDDSDGDVDDEDGDNDDDNDDYDYPINRYELVFMPVLLIK